MQLKENSLVLYKTQPAIVSSIDSDKIGIITTSGTKKVRAKDIILLHEGPVTDLKKILAATLPPGNLSDATDFFEEESPSFTEMAELIWGDYPAGTAWIIWKTISESPLFECTSPADPIRIRPKEEADALTRKIQAKKEETEERSAFAKRLQASLAGKEGVQFPEDNKFLQDVEALALGKTDKSRTLKDAGLAETPQSAHRALLKTGYWKPDRNPWPSRHGYSSKSSMTEIIAPQDDERLDLTGIDAWAIDNEWSADPDDAVSFADGKLWIHIADPATTVCPDSAADIDARSRGSTLYIPEGAARMLADSSLDYYALGLRESSLALSFCITFSETGAVADVAIYKTRIRVTRLTYADASQRRQEPAFAPLFNIAERNIARRLSAGAVSIQLPEVHISVTKHEDGEPEISIIPVQSDPAADMVREMMLLTGEAAARFAFKQGIPFQYVSQEEPDIPKNIPEGLAGEYRKRRSMKSRKVGTIPADHAGLGLGMYSQVTSPLRRYGDLVAHQQLHLFLAGKKPLETDEMVARIAAGDFAARACTLAERESNLHWILVYLFLHPDWVGDAVIVEKNGSLVTILIPELGQEAKIKLKTDMVLNETIKVRAGNINIPDQTVNFIPL